MKGSYEEQNKRTPKGERDIMKNGTKNAAKTTKATSKATKKNVTRIHAGGGIMVDVIDAKAVKMIKTPSGKRIPTKATTKATVPAKAANVTNPYREGGAYHASVEALRTLGIGKLHTHDAIVSQVRKAMGSDYKEFAAKESRNENGKDTKGRILQNVCVIARKDYGKPLRDIGYEVRWDGREKVAGIFKLGSK